MSKILLVDNKDQELGYEEKLKVHEQGLLHRSFSIFIFNSRGELLLQKRAAEKYHSGSLWSNTCCSHQKPDDDLLKDAARQRLQEELGLDCELKEIFCFIYKVKVGDGLIENEFDHVFIGFSDQQPKLNPEEASAYKYLPLTEIKKEIKANTEQYTAWFKIIIKKYFKDILASTKK